MTAEMLEAVVKLGAAVSEVERWAMEDGGFITIVWPSPADLFRRITASDPGGKVVLSSRDPALYRTRHRTDEAGMTTAIRLMGEKMSWADAVPLVPSGGG